MRRHGQRNETYEIVNGVLRRTVTFADGYRYQHPCTLQVYKQIAYFVEERGEQGVTTDELWRALDRLPQTQVSTALAFLKDCLAKPCNGQQKPSAVVANSTRANSSLTWNQNKADPEYSGSALLFNALSSFGRMPARRLFSRVSR